ncbi:MAG: hypothetical protein IJS79_01045 [Oscillospiraceae bacterium]|nr:hypothetical protein [Oscillospiraceae bacterium]
MKEKVYPKAQAVLSACGLAVLGLLFTLWLIKDRHGAAEVAAALACLALFALVCLRFVPVWFRLWFGEPGIAERVDEKEKRIPASTLFAAGILWAVCNYLAVWGTLYYVNPEITTEEFLQFWKSADAFHYLCIARDWYLSEGELDRIVQLVFLPGYPIVVRLAATVIRNYVLSGLLVSTLCFAGALCVFYRVVLTEYGSGTAARAAAFLCLMPGAFFFFAPMSESLFLLLCAACLAALQKRRWLLAGLFGALASFTRSLGLMLFVPLFFELVGDLLREKKCSLGAVCGLLLVPTGFAGYLLVNYLVSGNPFQFMIYQREHWYQGLGLFFNTAAYQTRYALAAAAKGDSKTLMGLWLPNLAAVFGAPAILFFGAKRLRASETAWAIAYYVIAIGATWLLSAPRYMAVLLPLPTALGVVSERKNVRALLYLFFALANAYYLVMFALRRSVW